MKSYQHWIGQLKTTSAMPCDTDPDPDTGTQFACRLQSYLIGALLWRAAAMSVATVAAMALARVGCWKVPWMRKDEMWPHLYIRAPPPPPTPPTPPPPRNSERLTG